MRDDYFLQELLAAPDDDAPRLVYADYLEERGDADRAEFIRLQIELARLPAMHPRRPELRLREVELLHRHHRAWAGDLAGLAVGWQFRRGFVEAVTVEAPAFLARADELCRLAPVRAVEIATPADLVPDLAAAPALSRFRELRLDLGLTGRLDPRGLLALAASPHLSGVTSLGFRNTSPPLWDDGALAAWRDWPVLGRVTALAFNGCHLTETDDEVLEPLLFTPMPHLAHLDLGACDLMGAGALLGSPPLPRLASLDLRNNWIERLSAGLLAPRWAPRLTALDLSGNQLGEDSGLEFLAHPGGALRHLDLGHNALNRAELNLLLAAPVLAGLTSLGLSHQRPAETPDDSGTLRPRGPTGLTLLDLGGNGDLLRAADVESLLGAAALDQTTLLFSPRANHGRRNSDFALCWRREWGDRLRGPHPCWRRERHGDGTARGRRMTAAWFSCEVEEEFGGRRSSCAFLVRGGEEAPQPRGR